MDEYKEDLNAYCHRDEDIEDDDFCDNYLDCYECPYFYSEE